MSKGFSFPNRVNMPKKFWDGMMWIIENGGVFHAPLQLWDNVYKKSKGQPAWASDNKPIAWEMGIDSTTTENCYKLVFEYDIRTCRWGYKMFCCSGGSDFNVSRKNFNFFKNMLVALKKDIRNEKMFDRKPHDK